MLLVQFAFRQSSIKHRSVMFICNRAHYVISVFQNQQWMNFCSCRFTAFANEYVHENSLIINIALVNAVSVVVLVY